MTFGIYFDEENKIFQLVTERTSYVMAVVDGYLGQLYYGKKLDIMPHTDVLRLNESAYIRGNSGEKCGFMDSFSFEYSFTGTGDYRKSCLSIKDKNGFDGCDLKYKSHRIFAGKKRLEGLPATFGKEEDTLSLEITLEDTAGLVQVSLYYSIFKGLDTITKSVCIKNISNDELFLTRALSASLDMEYTGQELITLNGSWAREHIAERKALGHGTVSVSSTRGISSHQEHPFIALVAPNISESIGEVVGISFVYSGNFLAEVERTQHDRLRAVMGISDYSFEWKLMPEQHFTTPEVMMVYSAEGIGRMSRTFHDTIREHLIRSPYLYKRRPVLINNWEATYFDFNMDKLLEIARQAKKVGVDMLVMDDGWFGKRENEFSSLGDWTVNLKKLPEGVKGLSDRLKEIDMKLGIWFEPEMISPDSDLYREHPDWALSIPGREPTQARNQLVLDMTRADVRDYVYKCISEIVKEADISYIKWDMNRPLTDVGSVCIGAGEIHHRYMLGVYQVMDKLVSDFPELLLENCSSGGGRFDPGMLYYSPQIWCSDNTDAMERLRIQEGTSLIYPPSSMGAHVSICPNHIVGRTVDIRTRGYVALAGTFGYELDITKLSDSDKEAMSKQVEDYNKFGHLVREGDYYRITSVGKMFKQYKESSSASWMFVSKDKKEVLLTYIQERGSANKFPEIIHLEGLDEKTIYTLGDGRTYSGEELMKVGFLVDKLYGDGAGHIYHFTAE